MQKGRNNYNKNERNGGYHNSGNNSRMGGNNRGGYGKPNNQKRAVDSEKERIKKENEEKKRKEFKTLSAACTYLNERVDKIINESITDKAEYGITARSVIDALCAEGFTVDDSKQIAQFTTILSDIARAQTNKNIESHKVYLRIAYFVERLNAYFGKYMHDDILDIIAKNNALLYLHGVKNLDFVYDDDYVTTMSIESV